MKTSKLFFAILVMGSMSCQKNDEKDLSVLSRLKGESGFTYNESLSKWTELKRINGNSYIYQTTISSWIGTRSITELRIEDGVVTSRVYQEFKTNQTNGQQELVDGFTETMTNLGSHEKGANILTIDELYNSCAGEYITVDKEKNTIYFETEINGIMTLCGYVPNECMDDCYRGVSIDSFKWID